MNSYHFLNKSASPLKGENFVISPYSTRDGAMVGGLGGAALGGIAGLGKAVFDSEDDGIGSTLRKILTGVGAGGLAGAGIGAGAASGLRGKAVDDAAARLSEKTGTPIKPEDKDKLDFILRRFKLPLQPIADNLTGKTKIDAQGYDKEVKRTALMETLAQALSMPTAGLATKPSTTTVVRE